jgi:hypothetical protein
VYISSESMTASRRRPILKTRVALRPSFAVPAALGGLTLILCLGPLVSLTGQGDRSQRLLHDVGGMFVLLGLFIWLPLCMWYFCAGRGKRWYCQRSHLVVLQGRRRRHRIPWQDIRRVTHGLLYVSIQLRTNEELHLFPLRPRDASRGASLMRSLCETSDAPTLRLRNHHTRFIGCLTWLYIGLLPVAATLGAALGAYCHDRGWFGYIGLTSPNAVNVATVLLMGVAWIVLDVPVILVIWLIRGHGT